MRQSWAVKSDRPKTLNFHNNTVDGKNAFQTVKFFIEQYQGEIHATKQHGQYSELGEFSPEQALRGMLYSIIRWNGFTTEQRKFQ